MLIFPQSYSSSLQTRNRKGIPSCNYERTAAVITWRTRGECGEQLLRRLGRGHRNGLAVKRHLSV